MSDPVPGGFLGCSGCQGRAEADCSVCVLRKVVRVGEVASYGHSMHARILWRILQGTLLNLSLQAGGRQAGRQAQQLGTTARYAADHST